MSFSIKEVVFIFFSSLLLLLQFFIGDTTLNYYLIFGWLLFIILFYKHTNWCNLKNNRTVLLGSSAWLFYVGISCFFSHNLPLSLLYFFYQLEVFTIFIFFLAIDRKKIGTAAILLPVLVTIPLLAIFNAILIFLPEVGKMLPDLNVIFASYGHSHFAAPVILTLPLFIWFLICKNIKFIKYIIFLLVCILGVTTARVGIFTLVIQQILIFFFIRKIKLIFFYSSLFLILAGFVVLLTVSSISSPSFAGCSNNWFLFKCKPIDKEYRLLYWQQALSSFNDYPIFGYGPGTFQLINLKYRQNTDVRTLYAHNEFLQILSESGLIGLLLFTYFFYTLLSQIKKNFSLNRQKINSCNIYIFIGIVSLLFSCLFDYDLTISGVWIVLFIQSSVALQGKAEIIKNSKILNYEKTFFNLLLLLLILLSLLHLLVSSLIFFKKEKVVLKYFPYFFDSLPKLVLSTSITKEEKMSLLPLYENYSDAYFLNTLPPFDLNKQKKLFLIDKWKYFLLADFESISIEESISLGNEIFNELELAQKKYRYRDWDLEKQLSLKMMSVSGRASSQNENDLALKAYVVAAKFHPWIMLFYPIELNLVPNEDVCSNLKELYLLPKNSLTEQQKKVTDIYEICLISQKKSIKK